MDEAERAATYSRIVRAMTEAGNESVKWNAVKMDLGDAELDGYRDVDQLRSKAALRYEECVAEEQKRRQLSKEQFQREKAAAAAKKKRNTLIGVLAAVVVVAVIIVVIQVIIPANNYRKAIALQQAGKYEEALAIFNSIRGYKDVDKLLTSDQNLVAAARRKESLKLLKTLGSIVAFGTYPQTTGGTDATPIEWIVLDYDSKNNKALLLSRYGLDAQPYNTEWVSVTWETCSLRTWLNNTFMNNAFSAKEQSAILQTNVDNSKSHGYMLWKPDDGNNTQDRIFLLSYAEANKYLEVEHNDSKNTKSQAAPTAYVMQRVFKTNDKTADGESAGLWWLRSRGETQRSAALVYTDGSLSFADIRSDGALVRPVLWISLESDIF